MLHFWAIQKKKKNLDYFCLRHESYLGTYLLSNLYRFDFIPLKGVFFMIMSDSLPSENPIGWKTLVGNTMDLFLRSPFRILKL